MAGTKKTNKLKSSVMLAERLLLVYASGVSTKVKLSSAQLRARSPLARLTAEVDFQESESPANIVLFRGRC